MGHMQSGKTKKSELAWLHRRRLIHLGFIFAGVALNVLPRRLVFLLLVVCEKMKLPGRRRLATAYQPYAIAFLANHPSWRFTGK